MVSNGSIFMITGGRSLMMVSLSRESFCKESVRSESAKRLSVTRVSGGSATAALSLNRESTASESTASESGREGKVGRESLRVVKRLSFWTTAVSKGAWEKAQRHIKKATKTVQILFIVS